MIDTGSWVKDYSLTFSHWLLVGAAVILVSFLTCRLLRLLGMKTEAATGIALIMPWVIGFFGAGGLLAGGALAEASDAADRLAAG